MSDIGRKMHDGKWASERRAERDVEQNREGKKKERDVYNVTNVTGLVGGGNWWWYCDRAAAARSLSLARTQQPNKTISQLSEHCCPPSQQQQQQQPSQLYNARKKKQIESLRKNAKTKKNPKQ